MLLKKLNAFYDSWKAATKLHEMPRFGMLFTLPNS
jgi:hypothetical protein